MKTWQLLLIVLLTGLCLSFVACDAKCQTVDEPDYLYIDEDALTQRVDDLTEVVNTHTDQLEQLAQRVSTLESKPVAAPVVKRNLLGTELKKPKPLALGSVGSAVQVSTVSYSAPVVTYSQPVVTYSQPVYSTPVQSTVRSRTVQTTTPVRSSRLGSRLQGFFPAYGNPCPDGMCPR